jgi:elongation factor Ts
LLEFTSTNKEQEIEILSKNLCMHIAAMKPESLDIEDLDKNLVEREEKIQRELILSSGKPSNIIDKILEGKMKKFYSEVTLLNQFYILDQDKLVKTVIEEHSKYEFKLKSFEIISL